jgi:hypothetical protein
VNYLLNSIFKVNIHLLYDYSYKLYRLSFSNFFSVNYSILGMTNDPQKSPDNSIRPLSETGRGLGAGAEV